MNAPEPATGDGRPPHEAMVAASRFLTVLARKEPGDPAHPDGTLANVLSDELAPALREWAGALTHAAAKITRHERDITQELCGRLERAAGLLSLAGADIESAASSMRGYMRPRPWEPEPPRAADAAQDDRREGTSRRADPDAGDAPSSATPARPSPTSADSTTPPQPGAASEPDSSSEPEP